MDLLRSVGIKTTAQLTFVSSGKEISKSEFLFSINSNLLHGFIKISRNKNNSSADFCEQWQRNF